MDDPRVNRQAPGMKTRSRSGRRGLIILGALVAVWIGWGIWDYWNGNDPIRLIRSGNVSERTQAALELRVVSQEGRVEAQAAALIRALDDEDTGVRAMAAVSLGVLSSERPGLAANLREGREQVKSGTDAAIHALTKALSDRDKIVRGAAAMGLGSIGKTTALSPPPELIAAVKDPSPEVRAKAVESLSSLAHGVDSLIPVLLSMFENDESEVRTACASALWAAKPAPALVPSLIESLRSRNREVRSQSARLLGRIGPEAKPAVTALIATLKEPVDLEMGRTKIMADTWDPPCHAAIALGSIATSDDVIAVLIQVLRSGRIGQPGVSERRFCAAQGLRLIGPHAASAAPALIFAINELLDSKEDLPGAYPMAESLGQIAPNSASATDAVSTLIRMLDSKYPWARVGAAVALGKFGRAAAITVPKLRALELVEARELRDAARAAVVAIETAPEPTPTGIPNPWSTR